MGESADRTDDIGKAITVIVANVAPLFFFMYGSADIGAVQSGTADGIPFYNFSGIARFTSIGYMATAIASLLAAATSLVLMFGPSGSSHTALRAGGGLLGAAILVLALHSVIVVSYEFADDVYYWLGLAYILVPMVVLYAVAMWWASRRA